MSIKQWHIMMVLAVVLAGFYAVAAFAAGMTDTIHSFDIGCESCHVKGAPDEDIGLKSCLACHESYAELAKATQGIEFNPHDSHLGELACNLCHVPHGESSLYCANCHTEFEVEMPENAKE